MKGYPLYSKPRESKPSKPENQINSVFLICTYLKVKSNSRFCHQVIKMLMKLWRENILGQGLVWIKGLLLNKGRELRTYRRMQHTSGPVGTIHSVNKQIDM